MLAAGADVLLGDVMLPNTIPPVVHVEYEKQIEVKQKLQEARVKSKENLVRSKLPKVTYERG